MFFDANHVHTHPRVAHSTPVTHVGAKRRKWHHFESKHEFFGVNPGEPQDSTVILLPNSMNELVRHV